MRRTIVWLFAGLFLVAWVTGQRAQAEQWTGSGISAEPSINSVVAALPVVPGIAKRTGRVEVFSFTVRGFAIRTNSSCSSLDVVWPLALAAA